MIEQLRLMLESGTLIRSIILLAYGGLILFLALRSLRAQRLKERYVLLFLFTGTPFLVLAVWPGAIELLATALRMPLSTVLILCLTAFVVLIIFELFSLISVQERKIANLAQMLGILLEKQKQIEERSSSEESQADPKQEPGCTEHNE